MNSEKHSARLTIAVLGIIAIVAIGIVLYLVFSQSSFDETESAPSQPENSQVENADENAFSQQVTDALETGLSEDLKANLHELQAQRDAEVAEISANYSLPKDGTFEVEYTFPEITEQHEKVWYEPGTFKSDALVQWQCAWLKAAVLAAEENNADALSEALSQLESFWTKPEIEMFPDYQRFINDNVSPLKSGDTEPAREFLNSGYSCVTQNQLK